MAAGLDWHTHGADWPHRAHSRFVDAGGLRWHVQHWPPPRPDAPTWLLLHGTGASTHSWRGLAPLLAAHVGLIAPDLPGHAFTRPVSGAAGGRQGRDVRDSASMAGMARGVTALLHALQATPALVLGHSAGAAVAVRMALDAGPAAAATRPVVGLNAALLPLRGLAGTLFSPAAKLLALNPLVPHLFSWHAADRIVLSRLLASTGSVLDDTGTALYRRLIENPGHVDGVLAMMARWDLPALARELPRLQAPLHLLVGDRDGTVPPADAQRVRGLLPATTVALLPGLGHLAHEEAPAAVAAALQDFMPAGRGG